MENTSDSLMPRPLLLCLKSEKIVCYSVPDNTLFKFIKDDKHFSKYYEAIYILFNTRLHISEFCGLTIHGIDFKEM